MKFSIGDPIRVKKTGEEGKVVSILDEGMVEIAINGTLFPVYEDEIEHPYLHWFLQKQKVKKVSATILAEDLPHEKKKKKRDLAQHQPGFSLQFLPVYEHDGFEDLITKVKIYFINQSQQHLHLLYKCNIKLGNYFSLPAEILPYQTFYLHEIPYSIFLSQPEFAWDIYTNRKENGPKFQDSLRLKSKKIIDLIQKMQMLNEPTFSIQIAEVAEDDPLPLGMEEEVAEDDYNYFNDAPPARIVYEIDLHIEALNKKYKYLDVFEILQIQLSAFDEAMNAAILSGQDHLTIIHGVGNGKLKKEIHKKLDTQYDTYCYYIHDYMPKYGMGATQVIFN